MSERSSPPTPASVVVLIDPEAARRAERQGWLDQSGFETRAYPDGPSFLREEVEFPPCAVLIEVGRGAQAALELVRELHDRGSPHGLTLLGDPGEGPALQALRLGAVDCRAAGSKVELVRLAERALERAQCQGWLQVAGQGESQLERLTPREHETLALVLAGLPSKAIAQRMGVTTKTVEQHRSNVMHKLEVASVAQLVLRALKTRTYGVPHLTHRSPAGGSGERRPTLSRPPHESATRA